MVFSHFSWFCKWLVISQIHGGVSKSTRMLSPLLNLRKYLANLPVHSFQDFSSLVSLQRTIGLKTVRPPAVLSAFALEGIILQIQYDPWER